MKVFVNELTWYSSGGLLLVAANSKEEAHEVFHADKNLTWMWDDFDGTICDHYYTKEDWKEMSMLSADVEEPQVLIESSYMD